MTDTARHFWAVCITHMFIEVYQLVQVALIPVFINEFQLTLLEASLVATVPAVTSLAMNIPAGFLADHVNTKHILSICMTAEGLSALIISQTNNFWMLVLAVAMMRVASPLYHIAGLCSVSGTIRQEKLSRSMGFHNALGSLGTAVGLVSLSVFQSTIGWRYTYIFWAVPLLVWSLMLLRVPQPDMKELSLSEKESLMKRLPLVFSTAFSLFLLFTALREVAHTITSTFMTTYLVDARGVSEATSSLIFGLGPFIGIFGSLTGGYLGEKLGARKALNIVLLGIGVSLVLLALSFQFQLLVLLYLIYSLFTGAVWTPMNTIVANLTSSRERGLGFSVYFLTEASVVSLTPVAAATVISKSSIWFIFPLTVAFLASSLIALQLLPDKKAVSR